MTELEYLNLLPDMSRFQDINEASFLKSIPNQSISMPDERLRDLQEQLEHHKKQLEQYEQKSALESEKSSSSQIDIERLRLEKDNEIQDLK